MTTTANPLHPTAKTRPAAGRARMVMDYTDAFALPILERIDRVKMGIPAQSVPTVAADLSLTTERYASILGLPKSTVARKIKNNEMLPQDQSERMLRVMRLIGLVERLVSDYGDPQGFVPATWFGHWIEQPNPALNGRQPSEFLDTATGAELVESLLNKMVSGAYA